MRATRFQPSDVVIAPAELEFLAEEELVTIVSSVSTTEVDQAGNSGYLSLLSGALLILRTCCCSSLPSTHENQSRYVQGRVGSLCQTKNLMCPCGWLLSSEDVTSAKSKSPHGCL
jgi:hypothetical protein